MTLPKLLYFTFNGLENDSGYAIQFLAEAEELLKRGYPLEVLTFTNWRKTEQTQVRFEALRKRFNSLGGGFNYRIIAGEYRSEWFWALKLWISGYLRKLVKKLEIDIIHAHGLEAGYLTVSAMRNSSVPAIADFHGVTLWEKVSELSRDGFTQAELAGIRKRKQVLIDSADRVFCVSEYFKSYLNDTYFANLDKTILTPSGTHVKALPANEHRETLRNELGLAGKFILVYAGSTHHWQQIDEVFRMSAVMLDRIPEFHLLVLSRSAEKVKEIADRHNFPLDRMTVRSLQHDEMHNHLAVGDVSVMLRENNLVNKVASPIKFAEYLAAGLPVILTDCIGDSAILAEKEKVGFVINQLALSSYEQVTQEVQQTDFTQELRERCNQVAKQVYDWSVIMRTFEMHYEQLMKDMK
jgi:glycosyltransferase involved in cell wall biosynthesis